MMLISSRTNHALLVLLMMTLSPSLARAQWDTFSSSEDGFSVTVPTKAKIKRGKDTRLYIFGDDWGGYTVNVMTYGPHKMDPKKIVTLAICANAPRSGM